MIGSFLGNAAHTDDTRGCARDQSLTEQLREVVVTNMVDSNVRFKAIFGDIVAIGSFLSDEHGAW